MIPVMHRFSFSSKHDLPNFSDDDDLTETVHLGRERQRRAKQCSSLKFFIYKQQLLIWSFRVVAILMAEFRWKLSFQPGLSQPVSPTTANSYRSITFWLFRHRQSFFFSCAGIAATDDCADATLEEVGSSQRQISLLSLHKDKDAKIPLLHMAIIL